MTSSSTIAEAIANLTLDEPERRAREFTLDRAPTPLPSLYEERERPCCARLPHGGWCQLADGHAPPCDGAEPRLDVAPPPADRKLMAAHRALVSRKWDPKTEAAWCAEVEGRKL